MRAMVLEKIGRPLTLKEVPCPIPEPHEVLIKVEACGVCRTDLHIVDGELPAPHLPLILGHQIVGTIEKTGPDVPSKMVGMHVGVPWLSSSCHVCEFCLSGRENLCDSAVYTGYQCNGGYAEYCTAHKDFVLPLPEGYDSLHAAPLLCAGLIGYRALRLASPAKTLGLYGFGSSAHLLVQVASALGCHVYVFTRTGDLDKQNLALSLGATWAGGSDEAPPCHMDASILFAPEGALYPQALTFVKKGGKVISAGIHMSDIPSFPYSLLWGERTMTSVANLTRQDGIEFLQIASQVPLRVLIEPFALADANQALKAIRDGMLVGSAVLFP